MRNITKSKTYSFFFFFFAHKLKTYFTDDAMPEWQQSSAWPFLYMGLSLGDTTGTVELHFSAVSWTHVVGI